MFNVIINPEMCKSCELCIDVCPKKIIDLNKDVLNSKGFHPAHVISMKDCIGCKSCGIICPDCAIEIEKGEKNV